MGNNRFHPHSFSAPNSDYRSTRNRDTEPNACELTVIYTRWRLWNQSALTYRLDHFFSVMLNLLNLAGLVSTVPALALLPASHHLYRLTYEGLPTNIMA